MSILPHCFGSEFMEERRDAIFEEGQKEAHALPGIDPAPANTIEHQLHCHFVVFEPVPVFETLQEEVFDFDTLRVRALDLNGNQRMVTLVVCEYVEALRIFGAFSCRKFCGDEA